MEQIDSLLIEPLATAVTDADLGDLAGLLVDAVSTGAAVSFLAPLSHAAARAWWDSTIQTRHPRGVVLVARDRANGRIVGTAQLQPAWAPNQPHRAEVCKVLVHQTARRRGIGRRLMLAIEAAARAHGFTLLTLDARADGPAEQLYRRMNWTAVGSIPNFAIDADGRGMHATVVFYKAL